MEEQQVEEQQETNLPKSKQRLSLNTIVSLCALLTSVATVSVIFYQASLQRQQQYASVTPILETYINNGVTDSTSEYLYEFAIANQGIGPAIIERHEFRYNGNSYQTFRSIIDQLKREHHLESESTNITFGGLWNHKIIPAGAELKLISLRNDRLAPLIEAYPIQLIIEYRSIYGEKWRFDNMNENQVTKL